MKVNTPRSRYNVPIIRPFDVDLTGLQPGSKAYKMGKCKIFVSPPYKDDKTDMGWHLSISCRDRLPTWEEVQTARYELLPKHVNFVMVLPKEADYVNLHDYCFHLHELLEDKAIGQ